MGELLPTLQAESVRKGLVDYLTTTFALADAGVRDALGRFLSDPDHGMFSGPYVRLRLPFRPADPGWRNHLEWAGDLTPYVHQAEAFARLSSYIDGSPRRPQPTLVTTGTGSGKTEAFLYPIIDHVLRARRDGITGMKALLLYPMNALANDQAQRLARLITETPELAGVTAALYVGESGKKRTSVTSDGLITDRAVMNDSPPDILLTNYKMLDHLLLRANDQELWRKSSTSLQYLVLDEFHTYDGAQGTDVAMLLRRLGLALKSYWAADDPAIDDEDRDRPLGKITPVATSATLGDKGDPTVMVSFAETVFGEPFDAGSVIIESRVGVDEWAGDAADVVERLELVPRDGDDINLSDAIAELSKDGLESDGDALTRLVFRHLYDGKIDHLASVDTAQLLAVSRAHPLVQRLVAAGGDARSVEDTARLVVGDQVSFGRHGNGSKWVAFLPYLIAALGHLRAEAGQLRYQALTTETHLWIRELTRIDRAADTTATFRWSDDGPPVVGEDRESPRPSFPAVYCRHCGRSGWGIGLTPAGDSLDPDDSSIRRNHAAQEGRFRALIYAPAEAEADAAELASTTPAEPGTKETGIEGLRWLLLRGRVLERERPGPDDEDYRDGWVLPVLTTVGSDADELASADRCPACGQADGIRFLGSAIATLLSVSLSTMFGSPQLDPAEKKALVFTDSVQDAAHRAGFVQARSHTLTFRGALQAVIAAAGRPISIHELADEVIRTAGDDPFARYRIVPPDLADRDSFAPFWRMATAAAVPQSVRRRVRNRIALDIAREFGMNSRLGRTLELTGTAAAGVDGDSTAKVVTIAGAALEGFDNSDGAIGAVGQRSLPGTPGQLEPADAPVDAALSNSDATLIHWVRGVLERMRAQGGIAHPWLQKYIQEDGNLWRLTGGRQRGDGMPAFPYGRAIPTFPRVGGKKSRKAESLDAVTSPRAWYALWAARVLGMSVHDAGLVARRLFEQLARNGIVEAITTDSGGTVYALPADRVVVETAREDDLTGRRHLLVCALCHASVPGSIAVIDQLDGAPCMVARCPGQLERAPIEPGFYRTLYTSKDMRRIVAREHTSLLDDDTRLTYEREFKSGAGNPQAPNVLVATPTLEMGIDIGDLSAVFLSSLPRSVASYLQRIGRAGRLTGNALDLAFVTGRGEHLPKLGDPLSVINGEVRPPATYLKAEEILRRQYTAHLADQFARDAARPHPKAASGAIASSEPDTYLGDLIAFNDAAASDHLDRFCATFGEIGSAVHEILEDWAVPDSTSGVSELAGRLHEASNRWAHAVEELGHRRTAIDKLVPELEAAAVSPAATDEDQRALRSARTALKLTSAQLGSLRSEYWIGVLEEYGVLPNYTLLGDAVVLNVGISWIDPDTSEYHTEPAEIRRNPAQAIREFAPGSRFYARGLEIYIDAVDLGVDGVAVRPWALCPACGYTLDVEASGTEQTPARCPRCGSAAIADTGQRLNLVELTRVSAEIRRDEAAISDRDDERHSKSFETILAADPDDVQRRWYVEGTGFGCTYARTIDLTWLNTGTPGQGTSRLISGHESTGGLFDVCTGCGKLAPRSGASEPRHHRPWCPHRTELTPHTVEVALARRLRTQGILFRLPYSITIGDEFAVPSLSAAILLGLRERLGGDPDHLAVEATVEATQSDGSQNHDAILLHDTIPGGTGYLADLADPAAARSLLWTAWRHVRDCECQHEGRLACHRCLLPFAPTRALSRVSRASAEQHLHALLQIDDEAGDEETAETAWAVTEDAPTEDPESHLEQRFRSRMITRLEATGAAMEQISGPTGVTVRFTLPADARQWKLTPQVQVAGCKPDFVLSCNDANVPQVAIFTDGWAYHATELHNRLADDATKRANLRDLGFVVMAVTSVDIDNDADDVDVTPTWFTPHAVSQLIAHPQFASRPAAYDALRIGPIDWLLRWITAPEPEDLRVAARAIPMMMLAGSSTVTIDSGTPLYVAAAAALNGSAARGSRSIHVYREGALATAIEKRDGVVACAALLDDRAGRLGSAHGDAWRSWLQLANMMALRDWPTSLTTLSLASETQHTDIAEPPVTSTDGTTDEVSPEWRVVMSDAADGGERELIRSLAGQSGIPVPQIGAEGPEGIPLDVSWSQFHVAVEVQPLDAADRADLEARGWTVVPAQLATVVSTIRERAAVAADAEGGNA